jgi:hypothetical protein
MKPLLLSLLFMFVGGIGSWSCQAQLKDRQEDFSIPAIWGPGSFVMQWGVNAETLRSRGEGGMSDKSGKHFGIIPAGEWQAGEGDPYSRSIVSRVIWPLGTVVEKDVGRTITFTGMFGWYGGQPDRNKDLFLAKESGFWLEGVPLPVQGLKEMQDFEFGSIPEKSWEQMSISYRIRREDVGKDLYLMIQTHSRKENPGLPTLATSDWKVKVSP